MESIKDRTVIVQNVVTCIEEEYFVSSLMNLGILMKGIEQFKDENGEFSGTYKLQFDNAAQATQCVQKLNGLNFVGIDLVAI